MCRKLDRLGFLELNFILIMGSLLPRAVVCVSVCVCWDAPWSSDPIEESSLSCLNSLFQATFGPGDSFARLRPLPTHMHPVHLRVIR